MMKKIKVMIPYIIISIIIILGMIIKVYADYLYSSSDVYYENNNSTLTSSDLQSAIEELDTKCENRIAASQECPEGYKCEKLPICKRATTLHTEKCEITSTSSGCRAAGYSQNATITYGSLGTVGSEPTSGDAFDCDVNGDGTYDASTERFYYVSKRYLSGNQKNNEAIFDNNTYVFIYFSNYYYSDQWNKGITYNRTKGYAELSDIRTIDPNIENYDNWHGPISAVKYLPLISEWSNVSLKNTSRQIYTETGTTLTSGGNLSEFSYLGKAARLLTYAELYNGCYDGSHNIASTGGLQYKCKYLFENTYFSNSSKTTRMWLETPVSNSTNEAFDLWFSYRSIESTTVNINGSCGVRPVIEVNKNDISY